MPQLSLIHTSKIREIISDLNPYVCAECEKVETEEAEKCPHPREPLSGNPTAQIGGLEMIAQCAPYTAPVFV